MVGSSPPAAPAHGSPLTLGSPLNRAQLSIAAIILISFTTLLAMFLVTLSANDDSPDRRDPVEEANNSVGLGHVHGLGVDPGDKTLYAATHYGVFRVAEGEAERVADRWQDTMGFAVVGPQHFLASGHPDLRDDLPPHLGLIESRDGAETWQAISLQGEADLHAIELLGDSVVAFDATSRSLVVSDDRQTWRSLDKRPLVDLAVDPADVQSVYATTPKGELLRFDVDTGQAAPVEAPPLVFIDWDERGLVGLTAAGEVFLRDEVSDWQELAPVRGQVQAFDASPVGWHAATDEGIVTSTDRGLTWQFVPGATG